MTFKEHRSPERNTPSGWASELQGSETLKLSKYLKLRLNPMWQLIRTKMRGPILDAGCGYGVWVSFLNQMGLEAEGLDYSESMIEWNRRHREKYRWHLGKIQESGLPNDSYGGVISWGVIEHDENGPAAALKEFFRLIRPGGYLLVTVPVDSPKQRRLSAIETPNGSEFYQFFFTEEELVQFLRAAGFEDIEGGPASRAHPAILWPRLYLSRKVPLQLLLLAAAFFPKKNSNMIYALGRKPS